MNQQTYEQSIIDIRDSLDELDWFVNYLKNDLIHWKSNLVKACHLPKHSKRIALTQYTNIYHELELLSQKIISLYDTLQSASSQLPNKNIIETSISNKKYIFLQLRSNLSFISSTLTFLNWQSPAIKSSNNSRTGLERYPIIGDYNDYKRDRSGDTFYCEDQLKKHLFIATCLSKKPILNLCNSGMAAFTAIVYFLMGENIIKNKIIVSSDIYIENQLLLKKFFNSQIDIFQFNESSLIVKYIIEQKPDVVFLDIISNTFHMSLYNVRTIIIQVAKQYNKELFFVIDATCSVGYENILDNLIIPDNIKVLIHGSILKASQLGMERINAGFILSYGLDKFTNKILEYRTLSGTSIQDVSGYLIPITTKQLLRKRLKIIERNTIIISNFFIQLDPYHKVFKEIIYPGLQNHKNNDLVTQIGFAGPFFNIKFVSPYNNDKYFECFTQEILYYAKKYNSDLVHGGSYGFNETSIYYSVGWDSPADHYLRFSLGVETVYELEIMKLVFTKAFKSFRNRYINN